MLTTQSHSFQKLNLIYQDKGISQSEKKEILNFLATLHPIWEERYSKSNPPPAGENNRSLLRPVYWLGNWQFACLNYYHPPKGTQFRCVSAEHYPPVLKRIIQRIESQVKEQFAERDVPRRWQLNTCLINYYGEKFVETEADGGKWIDSARVGEHKDFEPGPVASISFGESAIFQFVKSSGKKNQSQVVLQQRLDDCSLQIFGGEKFKNQLFHRVQRVENKGIEFKDLNTSNFKTRRINFTFRYVPDDHIQPMNKFPTAQREDIHKYVLNLAHHSEFWKNALK